MQYEKPVSCIVAGRLLVNFWDVGGDHTPRPTDSVFIDKLVGFMMAGGLANTGGGHSLLNLLLGVNVKEGAEIPWRLSSIVSTFNVDG